MNTLINILPWLLFAAAGVLYFFSNRTVKKQKSVIDSKSENIIELKKSISIFQKDLMISNEENQTLISRNHELNREKDDFKSRILSLENENYAITKELDKGLNQIEPNAPLLFQNLDHTIDYKGKITWTSLEINIALLIEDMRLFDVFKKLLNSKLLPDSIQEQIDLQQDDLSVKIWCQNFNPDGDPWQSLTWLEIIEQIINKKLIITNYLQEVIQDSNRAMVVHQALSEKPKKESEVASA
jgi:hypothetical protein